MASTSTLRPTRPGQSVQFRENAPAFGGTQRLPRTGAARGRASYLRAGERRTSLEEYLQAVRGLMIGAQRVRPGAASQSRPKRGRGAADLACGGLLPFQPQVSFPVQLKLQMVLECRDARLVPQAAPSAVADPLREAARLDCDREPLSGLVAEFAFSRGEHLACLPLLNAEHEQNRISGDAKRLRALSPVAGFLRHRAWATAAAICPENAASRSECRCRS